MLTAYYLAKSTITLKDRFVFEFADTPTSVDFLQSSLRALQDLEDYIAEDDAQAIEAAKQLYIAKLNLLVGRDVLERQTLKNPPSFPHRTIHRRQPSSLWIPIP